MYGTMDRTDTIVSLTRAIREHSSMTLEQIREAGDHGADAGWPGFTYTSDGEDFYRANQRAIVALLSEDADEFGHDNVAQFVASFTRADMTDVDGGYECLCAWYALETVGRFWNERNDRG
jgi:hypothetical protein